MLINLIQDRVTAASICAPSPGVVTRLIEDKMLIVPIASEIGDEEDVFYVLNKPGQSIWQKFDNKKTIKMLVDELFAECSSSSAELQCHVLKLANELHKRGLLSIKGGIPLKEDLSISRKTLEIREFSLWNDVNAKRLPVSFDMEVTARCNNNCRHCYINLPVNDQVAQKREMSLEEIKELADQAVRLGSMWCLITGGEPLLRTDFAEIYLALKRKGLLVSVFTNATLVNEQHVSLFRKYPPYNLEVTVYGVTQETYERVTRVPGSFDAFMRGLAILINNGIKVRLKAVALRTNLQEQAQISEFCISQTKDYFRVDPTLNFRYDSNNGRNKEICAERLTPEQIIGLDNSNPRLINALRKRYELNRNKLDDKSDYLFRCGAGQDSFSVSYDGIFRLCSSLWADGMTYNLRSGTLADAWNNFVPRIREIKIPHKDKSKSCHKCKLLHLCAWCPANAHLETGVVDEPISFFCAIAHARADNLGITI